MRLISEGAGPIGSPNPWKRYSVASVVVAASAAAGSAAVDADSDWYRGLSKPGWQPPSWAFGVVWTPMYASIAFAAGHALGRTRGRERVRTAALFGINLTLNAGWTWLFFRQRSPRAALVGTLLLDLCNAGLIRQNARTDPVAARALLPYAAWCVFATVLNGSLSRRNP
ncbi:TspO/MBR family protein [Streptomyces sp. NPDC058740]|uniref:TspO/MBR family protein n=1 Tax=Streptomyces sp. NPDC058740 TaxID=3346619 RepID=UPI00368F32B1